MNYKILLVDDDKDLLQMLRSYFELKGYFIKTAVNGLEAMERIKDAPDIILLDVNMPGLDGLEVCRQIRDKISCPIMFLTAKVEEQDRINGLMVGGDDYVLKPFSLKELEARITAADDASAAMPWGELISTSPLPRVRMIRHPPR